MAERPKGDVEHFAPTTPHAESRSETLARVVHDEHLEESPGRVGADPTTASDRPPRAVARALAAAGVGAVFGAIVGLVLALTSPGPFAVDGIADTAGYMVILGGAFAVIAGLVAGLLLAEREDGRTEDAVEEEVGEEQPPPAG
ncbi:MAG: hypothetical protein RIB67_01095 [Miltoncostaeaceae bacterium]